MSDLEKLNPLEREMVENLIRKLCLDTVKDVVKEIHPKIAELAAAAAVGRITEEDAEIELAAFLGALQNRRMRRTHKGKNSSGPFVTFVRDLIALLSARCAPRAGCSVAARLN